MTMADSPNLLIKGVGIDIVKIQRIENMITRFKDHFKNRIFTENEIAYADSFANPYGHYAMRFAAKEAFLKSVGKIKNFNFKLVEVISGGTPRIHLLGTMGEQFDENRFVVSLSDEKEFAVAVVIFGYPCEQN